MTHKYFIWWIDKEFFLKYNFTKQRPISGFMYGHVVHIFYYSILWCVISMIWGCNALLRNLHAIRNWNKELNDMVCYTIVYFGNWTKTSRYTEVFQTFQSEKIIRQCLPLICNVSIYSIKWKHFKSSLNHDLCYAMLCYAMIWYDKWKSMRLYVMCGILMLWYEI